MRNEGHWHILVGNNHLYSSVDEYHLNTLKELFPGGIVALEHGLVLGDVPGNKTGLILVVLMFLDEVVVLDGVVVLDEVAAAVALEEKEQEEDFQHVSAKFLAEYLSQDLNHATQLAGLSFLDFLKMKMARPCSIDFLEEVELHHSSFLVIRYYFAGA